jgi:hypothetical protein
MELTGVSSDGRTKHEARMKIEAMLWIVVLILVVLAFLFPKTRSFSLSAIGVAIVAIVAAVVIAKRSEPPAPAATAPPAVEKEPIDFERFHIDKLDKADAEAKNRIRVGEIRPSTCRGWSGTRQRRHDRRAALQRFRDLRIDRLRLRFSGAGLHQIGVYDSLRPAWTIRGVRTAPPSARREDSNSRRKYARWAADQDTRNCQYPAHAYRDARPTRERRGVHRLAS